MGKIRTDAAAYRTNQEENAEEIAFEQQAKETAYLDTVTSAFQQQFNEYLNDLEEESIIWNAQLNEPGHIEKGAKIVFQKGQLTWSMEFALQGPKGGNQWRYSTRDIFEKADKTKFAHLLTQNLLETEQPTINTPDGHRIYVRSTNRTLGYMNVATAADAHAILVAEGNSEQYGVEGYDDEIGAGEP